MTKEQLEKENKKLKEKLWQLEWEKLWADLLIDELKEELAEQYDWANWLHDEIDYRKRECKRLKSELEKAERRLENMLSVEWDEDLYEDLILWEK